MATATKKTTKKKVAKATGNHRGRASKFAGMLLERAVEDPHPGLRKTGKMRELSWDNIPKTGAISYEKWLEKGGQQKDLRRFVERKWVRAKKAA